MPTTFESETRRMVEELAKKVEALSRLLAEKQQAAPATEAPAKKKKE